LDHRSYRPDDFGNRFGPNLHIVHRQKHAALLMAKRVLTVLLDVALSQAGSFSQNFGLVYFSRKNQDALWDQMK
jgi:hypothetical protein